MISRMVDARRISGFGARPHPARARHKRFHLNPTCLRPPQHPPPTLRPTPPRSHEPPHHPIQPPPPPLAPTPPPSRLPPSELRPKTTPPIAVRTPHPPPLPPATSGRPLLRPPHRLPTYRPRLADNSHTAISSLRHAPMPGPPPTADPARQAPPPAHLRQWPARHRFPCVCPRPTPPHPPPPPDLAASSNGDVTGYRATRP